MNIEVTSATESTTRRDCMQKTVPTIYTERTVLVILRHVLANRSTVEKNTFN